MATRVRHRPTGIFKDGRLLEHGAGRSMEAMSNRMRLQVWGLAAALGAAAAGAAWSARPAPDEAAHEAARERIEARQKADRKGCGRLEDNARDICQAEAKGRARVALARLEARLAPGPEADQAVMEIHADAELEVARERCDDARGKARKTCIAQAEAAHEAAVRHAMVMKVRNMRALEAQREAPPEETTPEEEAKARYAAEKARCVISGPDRDRCLEEAKRRFGKT